jgi:excisionase family DNA binding protein
VKDGEAVDGEGEAVGTREVPDLALSLPEAAAALGVSRQSFRGEILTDLQVVRFGRRSPSAFASWHIGSTTAAYCPAWRREVMMQGKRYLTVEEVAELARCHHNTVRRAIDRRRITAFRPAGRILVREADARAWIEGEPSPVATTEGW